MVHFRNGEEAKPNGIPYPTKRSHSLFKVTCIVLSLGVLAGYEAGASDLAVSGFEETEIISGLRDPSTMTFAPDGRLFIAERIQGRIRIARQNPSSGAWTLLSTPFKTFDVPNSGGSPIRHRSSGVRGFAFDPNFSSNRYLYVFYMKNNPRHNRVVRIRASAGNPDVAESGESLLMDVPFNVSESSGSHNGGAVAFGADGKLYFTTGDGWNGGATVQSLTTFTGKLFRINTDGSIPSDNPFFSQTTGAYRAIWALGFRNPFSMSRHPDTGELYINDVFGSGKDAIHRVVKGANYTHDGFGGIGSSTGAWGHAGLMVVTGGAWCPSTSPFPSVYHGSYFVASWNGNGTSTGKIRYLKSKNDSTARDFANNVGQSSVKPVYPRFGPDGFLYYMNTNYETTNGTVYRIRPAGGGAHQSTISVSALDPNASETPGDPGQFRFTRSGGTLSESLSVHFSLSGSASAGDYAGLSSPVTFAVNQTQLTLSVTPVDDGTVEGPETLIVTISGNANYQVGTPNQATVTIQDNDYALREPDHPSPLAGGLDYQYFHGSNLTSVDDLGILSPVATGTANTFDIGARTREDQFGFRFIGFVEADADGVYTFFTNSDDGSILRIGSTEVVNNDGLHGSQERSGQIGLKAGLHALEVLFFQGGGGKTLSVLYEGPGISKRTIPDSKLHRVETASTYGLDHRPVIGAYLNGNMPTQGSGNLPARLSATGAFSDVGSLTPETGVMPYDVNSKLWSDGASKFRWVSVPTGTHITFAPTGEWQFPEGTITIKHFEISTDENNPNIKRRLETRLLVKSAGGWYGVTYKWRADNSDADLLSGSLTESISIAKAGGGTRTQQWQYPSRSACLQCHSSASGFSLGLNTRQLNGDFTYSSTGRTDNQLRTWSHIDLLDTTLNDSAIAGYDSLVTINDASASLEKRARSYLDVNCAMCHRPGGSGFGSTDMRFDTPLFNQNLINGSVGETLGIAGARVVVPQDPARSILFRRMDTVDPALRMPPIGRTELDPEAIATLRAWIDGMEPPGEAGLAAHWKLDEGSGANAVDASGNGHDGQLDGPAWTNGGKVGGALRFDGSNDFVDAGTFDVSGEAITLAGWLNADRFNHLSSHDGRILSKASGTATQDHYWMLSTIRSDTNTRLRFRLKTNGNTSTLIASSGNLQPGTWHHVAGTYDGSRMRVYLDGQEVGSMSKSGSINTNSAVSVWLGGNPVSATVRPFDGLLDDVRVYDRALSGNDIVQLLSGGAPPNQAPIAHAGSPQTVADADGSGSEAVQLNGSSSSDPDGTLVGYLWSENGSPIATGSSPLVDLSVGPHTLTLTVTDNQGATGSANVVVTVTALNNQAPQALAGADASAAAGQLVILDGGGSNDPDNYPQPIAFTWTQVSGPPATLSNYQAVKPSFTPSTTGTYTFRLLVSDGALSDFDEVSVFVIDSTPPSMALDSVVLKGTVADAGGVPTVRVNGQPATVSGNTWSHEIAVEAGENKFNVEAVDSSGNKTTQVVTINK